MVTFGGGVCSDSDGPIKSPAANGTAWSARGRCWSCPLTVSALMTVSLSVSALTAMAMTVWC